MPKWTVLIAAALVGCSDPSPQSSTNTTEERIPPDPPAHTGNQWSDYIASQTWGSRDAMLGKIIETAGIDCELVQYHEFKGHKGKLAFWAAQCAGVGDYLVGIDGDSSTKVLPCKIPGLPDSDCWKPWPSGRIGARRLKA